MRDEDVRQYLEYMTDRGMAASTLNVVINALKFYYEQILRRRFCVYIKHAQKSRYLPVVLNKDEVKNLLSYIKTPKHYYVASFLYGSGSRVSEEVKIRIEDIDITRGLLRVYQGKGRKDRYTLLPKQIIPYLEA